MDVRELEPYANSAFWPLPSVVVLGPSAFLEYQQGTRSVENVPKQKGQMMKQIMIKIMADQRNHFDKLWIFVHPGFRFFQNDALIMERSDLHETLKGDDAFPTGCMPRNEMWGPG